MRRHRRKSIWWLVGVGLVVLAAWAYWMDPLGQLTAGECTTTLCCAECPSLQVSRVIDGDTFDSPAGRVRLYGVDTPERGERCYDQATARLRKLAGRQVKVEAGPRPQDPNGRFLYYVYTAGNGESIDEKLLREGLAQAWTRDGQHRDLLVEVERLARLEGGGCLWSGTAGQRLVVIRRGGHGHTASAEAGGAVMAQPVVDGV